MIIEKALFGKPGGLHSKRTFKACVHILKNKNSKTNLRVVNGGEGGYFDLQISNRQEKKA